MRRLFLILAVCALCVSCTSDFFDSGELVTLHFPINGNYSELVVSSAFDVTVSDEVTDVVVTIGEKNTDRVVVKVSDGELHIGLKPRIYNDGRAIAVIPSNVQLHELTLSGASSFVGDLSGDDVDVQLSGASDFFGHVQARELEVELSGASSASIEGVSQQKMSIDLSGASDLKAGNLMTQEVEGEMSGASTADVTCCTRLAVALSGASDLRYGTVDASCNPVVNCKITGGSTVQRRP